MAHLQSAPAPAPAPAQSDAPFWDQQSETLLQDVYRALQRLELGTVPTDDELEPDASSSFTCSGTSSPGNSYYCQHHLATDSTPSSTPPRSPPGACPVPGLRLKSQRRAQTAAHVEHLHYCDYKDDHKEDEKEDEKHDDLEEEDTWDNSSTCADTAAWDDGLEPCLDELAMEAVGSGPSSLLDDERETQPHTSTTTTTTKSRSNNPQVHHRMPVAYYSPSIYSLQDPTTTTTTTPSIHQLENQLRPRALFTARSREMLSVAYSQLEDGQRSSTPLSQVWWGRGRGRGVGTLGAAVGVLYRRRTLALGKVADKVVQRTRMGGGDAATTATTVANTSAAANTRDSGGRVRRTRSRLVKRKRQVQGRAKDEEPRLGLGGLWDTMGKLLGGKKLSRDRPYLVA